VNICQAEAMAIPHASGIFQAVVFSPPYWGLRTYQTGDNKHLELGSERLHDCLGWATGRNCEECFICHVRQYMREIWRVLRDDGVCWVNIADSYAGGNKGRGGGGLKSLKQLSNPGAYFDNPNKSKRIPRGNGRWGGGNSPASGYLKPKDLCLIPERLALALQVDGWWVRAPVIWHKPNPMPGSQQDRPTIDYEFIWMLTKSSRYYFDMNAVMENGSGRKSGLKTYKYNGLPGHDTKQGFLDASETEWHSRVMRAVWTIPTQPYSGSHYATYPEELVVRCLKASTSERGACPKCGSPWKRIIEKTGGTIGKGGWSLHEADAEKGRSERSGSLSLEGHLWDNGSYSVNTLGWQPTCKCGIDTTVPCKVYDPFVGSGTTIIAAHRLGLAGFGSDLSLQYLSDNARQRIDQDAPRF